MGRNSPCEFNTTLEFVTLFISDKDLCFIFVERSAFFFGRLFLLLK